MRYQTVQDLLLDLQALRDDVQVQAGLAARRRGKPRRQPQNRVHPAHTPSSHRLRDPPIGDWCSPPPSYLQRC